MPCYHPLQAFYTVREDGKKAISFSNASAKGFESGVRSLPEALSLPCGKCVGCRLEKSRQWAVRCVHEAKMHENNCFVTLTFDDDNLLKMCPTGSLDKKHCQDFMKRLRKKFSPLKIRTLYCGEYGEQSMRPHYHFILFGVSFDDRKRYKRQNGNWLYNSDILSGLWPFGHAVIGDFSFESAAYVARYAMKKVVGPAAEGHYAGRLPEFCCMSLKPGLGKTWVEKYGKTDCFTHDFVVVRGSRSRPPRYYDKCLGDVDPVALENSKEVRRKRALAKADDNTAVRLRTKEYCTEQSCKKLLRNLE